MRDDGAKYASVADAARKTGATESQIWHSILEGRAVGGHCADGYSAMESDRCDRWVEKLVFRKGDGR